MNLAPPLPRQDQPALSKYRPSIDGLRALAVLSVIGFHAFPLQLTGGFIGVDVFFVISGYLISEIILRGLEKNHFDFLLFYGRRIKRIFPALSLLLISVFSLGYFFLPTYDWQQLSKHVAASAGFSANFVFWGEAGYFDRSSFSKPLLHLWSLGIEEQFYCIWPALLYLAHKKRINPFMIMGLITCVSFLLNLYVESTSEVADFYSPLTRFWELSFGGLLACFSNQKTKQTPSSWINNSIILRITMILKSSLGQNILTLLGLSLVICGALVFHKEMPYPGWRALFPVIGTGLLLLADDKTWISRKLLSHPAFVSVGLISFPLYLWHWPLLTFARAWEGGGLETLTAIALIGFSTFLAFLTYIFIEKPIRFGKNQKYKPIILCLIMFFIGCCSFYAYKASPQGHLADKFSNQLGWSYWSDPICENKYHISPCEVNSGLPQFMILGDSHSNHLYPGMAFTKPEMKVIAAGTCLPLSDIFLHVKINPDLNPCEREDFLSINKQILKDTPSIKTVLISARWRHILTGTIQNAHEHELWGGVWLTSLRKDEEDKNDTELVNLGLARTIADLRADKRNIVFIRATPEIDPELEDFCKLRANPTPENCSFPRKIYLDYRKAEDLMIGTLMKQYPDLLIYDPIDDLCDENACYLMKNGTLLYRDNHHLSLNGSLYLGEKIKAWLTKKGLFN